MMSRRDQFIKDIADGNTCKGEFLTLGSAMLDGETITNAYVNACILKLLETYRYKNTLPMALEAN